MGVKLYEIVYNDENNTLLFVDGIPIFADLESAEKYLENLNTQQRNKEGVFIIMEKRLSV